MIVPTPPSDGAALASAVRTLARLAHQTLRDPHASPAALQALARQIASLQDHIPNRPAGGLALWLENLRAQVERRAPATAPAAEPDEASTPLGSPVSANRPIHRPGLARGPIHSCRACGSPDGSRHA